MPAGFRFLRPEGRTETIYLAECGSGCFVVELAALRQVCGLVEILRFKKGRGSLAGIGSEDRRVDQCKTEVVEVVSAGLDHFMPYFYDCVLAGTSQPEVPVLHQKSGTVLLGSNGKIFRQLNNPEFCDIQFIPAGRTRILANLPADLQA